jgi:hypothetical protein
MNINVRFDKDIIDKISVEISKAEKSIKGAIAWFTDAELEKLIGIKNNLLDGLILNGDLLNNRLSFKRFKSKVFYLDIERGLMHHKFCIIDDKILITGSYNWTTKARYYNKENIIIIEDEKVVNEFIKEYDGLKTLATPKENYIFDNLKEKDDIENNELFELEQKFNSEIESKIEEIKRIRTNEFRKLGSLAEKWVAKNTGVIAAKNLMLKTTEFPSGFENLALLEKLNLSFEESIINKEFTCLFSDNVKNIALNRLKKYEYFKSEIYSQFQNRY